MRIKRESISWLRRASQANPHPVVINESGIESAVCAGTPLALKFDASASPEILDAIDLNLFQAASTIG